MHSTANLRVRREKERKILMLCPWMAPFRMEWVTIWVGIEVKRWH